jgi:hypothetical protein
MKVFNSHTSLFSFIFAVNLVAAIPGKLAGKELISPLPTAAAISPSYITETWAQTDAFVLCQFEAPAPTIQSAITLQSIFTILPVPTSYPATVVETVISEWTLAYHNYYNTDGSNDGISIRTDTSTLPPTTTVLLSAPDPTPFVTPPVTVTYQWCGNNTITKNTSTFTMTACGAIECHSTYTGDLFGMIP